MWSSLQHWWLAVKVHTDILWFKLLCSHFQFIPCPGANIVEVLQANGATQLVDLAVKAGLGETLTGDGPFTVFAPTNEAFGELPAELVQSLVADTEMLKKVR